MAALVLLAEGREAEVFLRSDGTILKLLRPSVRPARIDREVAALRALQAEGHPVPRVVETVEIDGRRGVVLTRVEGENLLTALARRPLGVRAAARALGRGHAALHRCVAPPDLPELNSMLRRQIEAADALPSDLRARAAAILDALPPGDRLCHGDLHLGNLLGTWSAPVAIDWGDASRGDPAADVARTELLHRLGTPPPGSPARLRALLPIGRRYLAVRYLEAYLQIRPVDPAVLDRWRFVRAAARVAESVTSEHARLLRYLRRAAARSALMTT